MKILKNITALVLVMLLAFSSFLEAKDTKKKVSSISSSNYIDDSGTFDGNQIYADVTNNGLFLDYHVSGDSALEWPTGTGVHSIFQSSLWMGAKVDDSIRVIVADYTQDMGPGPWGGDPLAAVHRIYKVDKAMLASPLDFPDFQQWPTEWGAPWVDVDGDGVYSPLPNGPDHPEFVGDQVLWFVSNDGDPASKLSMGTAPLDVEIQTTMFGFDRPDVFGDMVFFKLLVISKGDKTLEDTYMGLWSDPDLGYVGDDLVGCDVDLGMGYVYNAGPDDYYETLDIGTPAAGYDFFQGPMVECDADEDCTEGAKMYGQRFPGYKNLKMSSFAFYINSDPIYTDPADFEEGYNYLQGLRKDGSAYPDDIAGTKYDKKFTFWGDPLKPHGVDNPVDGNYSDPDDRRFLMSVGPFTMAPGDSQEIVFGIFHAAAGDPLDSVAYLREIDALAQTAYDIDFALPDSPPTPTLKASSLSDSILLTWEGNAENYSVTSQVDLDEDGDPTSFEFEGYNVYQYETELGNGSMKRLATYDIKNGVTEIYDNVFNAELGETINIRTQFGSDSGVQRSHVITVDALNANSRLITNRNYYFAVTAYGYNPNGIPKTLESNPRIIAVRPEVPNTFEIGEETATAGDVLAAEHSAGPSGGFVNVKIVDPSALTGDSYEVTFNDVTDGKAVVSWNLTNLTTGEVLVSNNTIIGGIDAMDGRNLGTGSAPITEGFATLVNGTPASTLGTVYEWTAPWKTANELRDTAVGYVRDGAPYYSLGTTGYIVENRAGEISADTVVRDHDRFNIWYNDDVEIDFTRQSLAWNYADNLVNGYVPFTMYRHNFTTGEKEPLFAAYYDVFDDNVWDQSLYNGDYLWKGPLFRAPGWDPIYAYTAFDTDGDGKRDFYNITDADNDGIYDGDAAYIVQNDAFDSGGCGWGAWDKAANPDHYLDEAGCPGAYTGIGSYIDVPFMTATMITDYRKNQLLPNKEGLEAYYTAAGVPVKWTSASSIVFETLKSITSLDEFTFNTVGLGVVAKDYDVDLVSVWPNPYYGYNPEERDTLERRVMFSHLPEEGPSTIRIFALDGTLVKTIHHNDTGSQHTYWDLKNNFQIPVASGMYIAHVETNSGAKVLKLAVIQPEQRIDVY